VLEWYQHTGYSYRHMVVHTDSTSAIARSLHHGAEPGQFLITRIFEDVNDTLTQQGRTAEIKWVKAHTGTPGNERADRLAGEAAEKPTWSPVTTLAYLKLQISERFRKPKMPGTITQPTMG